MVLAKIADNDITDYIIASTYDVNSQDVYKQWTDSNYHNHRSVVRTKVSGSFTLGFSDKGASEYSTFLEIVNEAKIGNVLPITLFVANENQTREVECVFSFAPKIKSVENDVTIYEDFKMTVEEL